MIRHTRRQFLGLVGATALANGLAGCSTPNTPETTDSDETTDSNETKTRTIRAWTEAESPTAKTLYGVVQSIEGPYAVGGSGIVLARRSDGWRVVLERGPTAQGNTLRGAAVSDDGRNVWFAGGSGVVGAYDAIDEQLTDYSAPKGKTSTWEDVAAAGPAGSERVYLVNGSGEVLSGTRDGGTMTWDDAVKPGGGSSAKAVSFLDADRGYVCDTNAKVYETTDGGGSWNAIGIDGGSVGLYDVAPTDPDAIDAAGGDGSILRYNGAVWTKLSVSQSALYALDRRESAGLAAGGSGRVYERTPDGWEQTETPTAATLRGVALGTQHPDVAVGSGGTVLERSA